MKVVVDSILKWLSAILFAGVISFVSAYVAIRLVDFIRGKIVEVQSYNIDGTLIGISLIIFVYLMFFFIMLNKEKN